MTDREMIGYENENKGYGVRYVHDRKKPCLVIKKENRYQKVASFNNAESVRLFFDTLAEVHGLITIDWTGDDIPIGLLKDSDSWI